MMTLPCRKRFFPLVIILLLAGFHISPAPCAAEYLIDTARHFHLGGERTDDLDTADLNADGIEDMVGLCERYEDATIDAIVTRLGTGEGEFGEPVITLIGELNGDFRIALLNDDQYPDLLLSKTGSTTALKIFLGIGDGRFSAGDVYQPGTDRVIEPADFTGDGVVDVIISQPQSVRLLIGQGDGTFAQGQSTTLLYSINCVASGDLDGDGDLDLVVGSEQGVAAERAFVLRNDGSGNFISIRPYPLVEIAGSMGLHDMDGDGHLDLLYRGEQGRLYLCFGNGEDTFGASSMLVTPIGGWQVGDLDADGDLDLLVAHGGHEVLLNNGDGTFEEPRRCFGWGYSVALADMDGDDVLDALMISPSEYACVLLGRPDGTFHCEKLLYLEWDKLSLAMDDLDGDGDPDVAAGVSVPQSIQVLLNQDPGGFSEPVGYDSGVIPGDMTTGDLNSDGFTDILVRDGNNHRLEVLLNAGDGSFPTGQVYDTVSNQNAVALGDLDGDGDLDAALAYRTENQLGIMFNDGVGTLAAPVYHEATRRATDVILVDLDNDGDLDAAMDQPESEGGNVVVLRNNGDGSFSPPQLYDAIDPSSIAAADFDGDGDVDLATGSISSGIVSVLLNDGNGTYGSAVAYQSGHRWSKHFTSEDINLDGAPDLLLLDNVSLDLVVVLGNGDGSFTLYGSFSVGDPVSMWSFGDVDGDGDREAVLAAVYPGIHLINNNTVDLVPTGLLVTGPGPGENNPTLVRLFPFNTGRAYTEWSAYGVDRWGVNVALGELDGTPGPEVLTGAGPGAVFGPHVRGFQHDGTPLPGVSFLAYGTNKYGVNVGCGDLDGDGFDEIVTGAGPGAVFGPHVRGWNWDGAGAPTPMPGISYFAYGTPKWGVNVACGDIDGDGYDEIVTGAGPGAVYGPHVRGWNCDGGGASSIPGVSFFAYGTLKWGVNVSCGDIDGDGIDEIVTGAGPGAVFGPHVRAWNWDGSGAVQSIPAVNFFAYSYAQLGVNVSCGDLDNDGIDEIITGPGPAWYNPPRVRGWNYDGQTLTALAGVNFYAYDTTDVTHGVKVGGLRY